MDAFTNFLANNYVWFLIISLILIFALIGYLVDSKEIKTGKKLKKQKEELKVVDFSTIDQSKSLNQSLKEESSNSLNLDEYVKKSENNNSSVSEEKKITDIELETVSLDDSLEIPDLDNHQKVESDFK